MMDSPGIYYEWSELIKILETGERDSEVLSAMKNGKLEWQIGVAPRFVKMLMDVVDDRLNKAVDKFQYISDHETSNSLIDAIIALRRELLFLRDIVSIDAIDKEIRRTLIEHIGDFSKQIQSSLESSAQTDTTGKISSILKQNPVDITRISKLGGTHD